MIDIFDNAKVAIFAYDNAKVCVNRYGGTVNQSKNENSVIKAANLDFSKDFFFRIFQKIFPASHLEMIFFLYFGPIKFKIFPTNYRFLDLSKITH